MPSDAEHAVRAFIRGETGWDTLAKLGLTRSQSPNGVVIAIPADFPVVRPSLAEVASGLISHEAAQRQEWATLLLALDNVDLVDLEHDSRGPTLLEAIWDAARGRVSDSALDEARAILTGGTLQH